MSLKIKQIKTIQIAVRAAGIRTAKFESRYRFMLGQYKQPNGEPVTSCKQLTREQFEDILAICEARGWKHPDRQADHFRKLVASRGEYLSYGQKAVIECLYKDLGMSVENFNSFIEHQHNKKIISQLTTKEANQVIEALKNMLSKKDGVKYKTVEDVRKVYG